jgi:hypothetical protein
MLIRRLILGSCKLVSDDDDDDDEVFSTILSPQDGRSKAVSTDEDLVALSVQLPLRVGSCKVASKFVLLLLTLSHPIGSCKEISELFMDKRRLFDDQTNQEGVSFHIPAIPLYLSLSETSRL